jgi:hypothetical protein
MGSFAECRLSQHLSQKRTVRNRPHSGHRLHPPTVDRSGLLAPAAPPFPPFADFFRAILSTPLPPRLSLAAVPPMGTPVATVIAWGGTGASDGPLTWRTVRGGPAERFSLGALGPLRAGQRHTDPAGSQAGPSQQIAAAGSARQAGSSETGGIRNRRRGADVAPRSKIRKARPRAPLPDFLHNGQGRKAAWRG